MIKWRDAYLRQKESQNFRDYFGGGKVPPMALFRSLHYAQRFELTAGATNQPQLQNFPQGAIILGITAAAYQAQTTTGAFTYAPSMSPGRRDLFALSFQYTGDELITPGGPVNAEALLGGGSGTDFPARELVIAPSQGVLTTVENLTVAPNLKVHVVFHAMVLRTAN